jgi:hypothetical protein
MCKRDVVTHLSERAHVRRSHCVWRKTPKTLADNKRRAARARKARHRARQRRGERVFKLVADEQLIVVAANGSRTSAICPLSGANRKNIGSF